METERKHRNVELSYEIRPRQPVHARFNKLKENGRFVNI